MAVDTLLNNRFAINDTGIDPLGKGGMAVIYAGEDTETGLPVAAKTLLPDYQGDAHRRARFRREAEVLQAAQHPHVVELVDVVDGRRGTWILMEYLDGETLRQKLDDEGPFSPKTVNRWLAQVCAALEHMHQLGFVHLDITPQNIFLTSDGDAKLIDFGIAQKAYISPKREGDKLLGTAAYISPEHGSGQVVTPISDIYSLGCVVFELLTGKKVFSEHGQVGNDATISLRQDTVPELPTSAAPELDLPVWVDTVVARAILPRAEDRYPSATAFAEAFNAHANPPLFGLAWPRRSRTSFAWTPALNEPPQERTAPEDRAPRSPRTPSAPERWLRSRFVAARRTLLATALTISLMFGLPLLGGPLVFDVLLGPLPGSDTEVVGGDWYIRSNPGTAANVEGLLILGQSVEVTGAPETHTGALWWPVQAESGDVVITGWAHDDGLTRTWLMNRSAGLEGARTDLGDWWSDTFSWLPG